MPKVILISGGSDGLGKEIARKLAPSNQVVILAHNRTKLMAASKEINCDFVEAELTDFSSLKTAVDQVISKYHRIDVLVNNAGVWIEGQLEENDPEKIKNVVDINTTGTIFLTKAVLPQLRSQKSGQIINIVSQDGLCAKKDRSVYHASKWAITGFTKCIQEDVAGENIKVTAVYPGLMKTSLFEKNNVQRDLSDALDPAEVASLVESVINLDETAFIPEVSIKNITNNQNMDDSNNAPVIDLNIDPDLITPQDTPPQAASPAPADPTPSPFGSPAAPAPGVIDITPGVSANTSEPQAADITPPVTDSSDQLSHLVAQDEGDQAASPAPADPTPSPFGSPAAPTTPPVTPVTPVAPTTTPAEPIDTPSPEETPIMASSFSDPAPADPTPSPFGSPAAPTTPPVTPVTPVAPTTTPATSAESTPTAPASPIAEDPDLVKLVK